MTEGLIDRPEKKIRRLLFALADLESSLKTAGRMASAENIGIAAARAKDLGPVDSLHEMREALEGVLLGEHDLPSDIIGQILESTAAVDQILMQTEAADKEKGAA